MMANMYLNFLGQAKSTSFIGSEQEAETVHNFFGKEGL